MDKTANLPFKKIDLMLETWRCIESPRNFTVYFLEHVWMGYFNSESASRRDGVEGERIQIQLSQ